MIVALLPATLLAAAAVRAIDLWLGLRIFRIRLRDEVLVGTGGDDLLEGRMRAHANLVEYAPFVLILMALIKLGGGSPTALSVAGAAFVAARIAHPIGMDVRRSDPARAAGALITWVVLAFLVGWSVLLATGVA